MRFDYHFPLPEAHVQWKPALRPLFCPGETPI